MPFQKSAHQPAKSNVACFQGSTGAREAMLHRRGVGGCLGKKGATPRALPGLGVGAPKAPPFCISNRITHLPHLRWLRLVGPRLC